MAEAGSLELARGPKEIWPSFESLVQTHQRALYHFALRLTGNEQEAEDLLQESLLRAYRSFSRFAPGTAFDRWVYRIIYHLFVDGYRQKKRTRTQVVSLDEPIVTEDSEIRRDVADARPFPEDQVLTREFHGELKSALAALPPDFRSAVILCDVQGLAYEEIAQIMNCSIGTVRSRIHRGRRQLRERLRPYLGAAYGEANKADELREGQ